MPRQKRYKLAAALVMVMIVSGVKSPLKTFGKFAAANFEWPELGFTLSGSKTWRKLEKRLTTFAGDKLKIVEAMAAY